MQKQEEEKLPRPGPSRKGKNIRSSRWSTPAKAERAHTFPTTSSGRTLAAAILFKARTVIVEGQPQFQYGGYSFQLVDAWPVGWAYTDDCYIDYIDGEYFLFDLLHPGVRVAIIVVM